MNEEFPRREPVPLLIVISGPSGAGKDSVIRRMKERRLPFHFVVTATSRPRRDGEVHGQDYFFVTPEEFRGMLERGELLEHALVYGEYKGIPKKHIREALASGQDAVLRIDVQGAATIRRLCPEALLIFLTAASQAELIERLKRRRSESEDALQRRLATVREEYTQVGLFDYLVVNPDGRLDQAVDSITAIIHAEHQRVHPRRVSL